MGRESKKYVRYSTVGDGDCAIHAMFGEWNGHSFYCANAQEIREQVGAAIRFCKNYKEDTLIYVAIKDAISHIFYENENRGKTKFKRAIENYKKWMEDYKKRKSRIEKDLIDKISEVKSSSALLRMRSVEFKENCKAKYERDKREFELTHPGKQYRPYIEQSPIAILISILTKCKNGEYGNSKEIFDKILSTSELKEIYASYVQICEEEFDFDKLLEDEDFLGEYASIIEQPGYWLIQSELPIFAAIMGKTIEFYSVETKRVIDTYNLGKTKPVKVRITSGGGHYERVDEEEKYVKGTRGINPKWKRTASSQSSQSSQPTQLSQPSQPAPQPLKPALKQQSTPGEKKKVKKHVRFADPIAETLHTRTQTSPRRLVQASVPTPASSQAAVSKPLMVSLSAKLKNASALAILGGIFSGMAVLLNPIFAGIIGGMFALIIAAVSGKAIAATVAGSAWGIAKAPYDSFKKNFKNSKDRPFNLKLKGFLKDIPKAFLTCVKEIYSRLTVLNYQKKSNMLETGIISNEESRESKGGESKKPASKPRPRIPGIAKTGETIDRNGYSRLN